MSEHDHAEHDHAAPDQAADEAADAGPRIAGPVDVVVCRCGNLMNDWVDPAALARRAGPDPRAASVREQAFSCFGEGLAAIVESAKTRPVLLAACGAAMHGPTLARALAAAGLPADRARLVDVRGEGFVCRTRARGTAFAEALLAEELESVELPAEELAEPNPRVLLVGGGAAADEAAALLEAGGLAVEWMDDPLEPGDGAEPSVARGERGFTIARDGADAIEAGAVILAFEAVDRPVETVRPHFEPGAQCVDLATVESGFEDGPEPPAAPGTVALVTGCLPGAARSRAPGVGLARTAVLALALHERWPRAQLALFFGDATGAPAGLEALLADLRRAGGLTVRGAVHRGIWSEGQLHVHATDADLGRRIMVAADLVVVDPGQADDPRAAAWCRRLGIPSVEDLDPADVFTRVPHVLLASGPGPVGPAEAALRGAACAAHCLARLRT